MLASAHSYTASARKSTDLSFTNPTDTDSATKQADSVAYESQYLMTGGITRGPLHLSAAEHIRVGGRRSSYFLSGRGSMASGPLNVSLFAAGKHYLQPARAEATEKEEATHTRHTVAGESAGTHRRQTRVEHCCLHCCALARQRPSHHRSCALASSSSAAAAKHASWVRRRCTAVAV